MRLCSLIFGIVPGLLFGADYYVSGAGDDNNPGDSPATPFRTIQKAANLAGPGDAINVMNGEYTNACAACSVVDMTRSRTAEAWIVLRAYADHKPVLKFNGWNGILIKGGASYIDIAGLEVQGARAEYTFEYCRAERTNNNPLCNGNGISIDGRSDGDAKPHHIRIARNHVWQCAGGGINAMQTDYVTIEDNIVHENAWHSRFGNSGISVYQAWKLHDQPGPNIIIRRNRTFNNRSLVDWSATNKLSDGTGIIIGDLRNTQNGSNLGAYRSGVRVENNLSLNDGGAGIATYLADQVDIVNNTVYKDGQVVGYADIMVNQSASVKVLNNIAYSRRAARPIEVIRGVDVLVDYNLSYNGSQPSIGFGDAIADPRFTAPSTEWGVADFRPGEGSPAIGSGDGAVAPSTDLDGKPRPSGGRGATVALEPPQPAPPAPPVEGGV